MPWPVQAVLNILPVDSEAEIRLASGTLDS